MIYINKEQVNEELLNIARFLNTRGVEATFLIPGEVNQLKPVAHAEKVVGSGIYTSEANNKAFPNPATWED